MYERVIAAFPDALLEDAHDLPEVAELLAPEAHRISYDAPIHTVARLDATPLTPVAVNIKPCRVGDLRSLLDVYAETRGARASITYGGGMGELDVGRGQIQLLASLFHADGPNDTAPSGYNNDKPAADLPASPLPSRRRRPASARSDGALDQALQLAPRRPARGLGEPAVGRDAEPLRRRRAAGTRGRAPRRPRATRRSRT